MYRVACDVAHTATSDVIPTDGRIGGARLIASVCVGRFTLFLQRFCAQ